MNRKLLNGLIVAAVALGGVGTFTSCKDEDYASDLQIGQSQLQAQIAAIRNVTDTDFQTNLEAWLNRLTSTYSQNGFATYADAVAALTKLNDVYEAIMDGNWDGAEEYVTALYDLMFNNIINGEDWYKFFFQVAERATSVEINSTYNPVLGSINLPVGLKSTIIAAYQVDEEATEMEFPTDASQHLAGTVAWSDAVKDAVDLVGTLVTDAKTVAPGAFAEYEGEGNMGGMYVNINPSSVDFTSDKYTVSLVNSQGLPVNLGEDLMVSANEDDFVFGVKQPSETGNVASTRTEGGVYKVMANAAEGNDLEYVNLNNAKDYLNDLKAAMKDKSISNIAYLGEQLYKQLNNRFPAYALEVAWEEMVVDPETGKTTETITNSVKSSYDIAAAVVTPLSYGLPVSEIFDAAHLTGKQLPMFSPLSEYLESINFEIELPTGMATIEYDEETNTLTITPADGTPYTATMGTDNDIDALIQAVRALNGDVEGVIDGLKSFNAAVEPFNDMLNRVKNSNKLNYADKLVEIYNKVAGKINNVLANPAHYLQVAAIYSDGEGYYHHLSTNPSVPVVASEAIELLLTSYTGDVVVPSMYKCVAVTAVDGKAVTSAQDAGEMVNVVFPGYQQRVAVDLSGFAGKTIQLTYVSVDYHGVTSAQNYYVKVQ